MQIELKYPLARACLGQAIERLNGERRASLWVFVELINSQSQSYKLKRTDFTLSLRDQNEKLLWVDQAHQLNGKWELKLKSKSATSIKLIFELPEFIVQLDATLFSYQLEFLDYRLLLELQLVHETISI